MKKRIRRPYKTVLERHRQCRECGIMYYGVKKCPNCSSRNTRIRYKK